MAIPSALTDPSLLPCEVIPCGPVLVPLLVSVMLSCMLLGVILVLGIAAHWGRTLATQAVLVVIVLVQVGQTGADVTRILRRFGFHFGQVEALILTTPVDATAVFLGVVCQLHTQAFLLSRAVKYASLTQATILGWVGAVVVGAMVVASAVCGFGVAVLHETLHSFAALLPSSDMSLEFKVLVHAWLISSTVVDCVLAASIAYELVRARKWSSGRTTNSAWVRAVARRLVLVVVHSGAGLALVQTATLVLWRTEVEFIDSRQATAYVFLTLNVLPKFYTLTFLTILLCMPTPQVAQAAASAAPPSAPPALVPTDHYTSFVLPPSRRASLLARPRPLRLPQPFADSARSPRSVVVHVSPPPFPADEGDATAGEGRRVACGKEPLGVPVLSPGASRCSFTSDTPCSATDCFPVLVYQQDLPPSEIQPNAPRSATSSERAGSVHSWESVYGTSVMGQDEHASRLFRMSRGVLEGKWESEPQREWSDEDGGG